MKQLTSTLNLLINENQVKDAISKRDFKTILPLFLKKPYLIFNETIYKVWSCDGISIRYNLCQCDSILTLFS